MTWTNANERNTRRLLGLGAGAGLALLAGLALAGTRAAEPAPEEAAPATVAGGPCCLLEEAGPRTAVADEGFVCPETGEILPCPACCPLETAGEGVGAGAG